MIVKIFCTLIKFSTRSIYSTNYDSMCVCEWMQIDCQVWGVCVRSTLFNIYFFRCLCIIEPSNYSLFICFLLTSWLITWFETSSSKNSSFKLFIHLVVLIWFLLLLSVLDTSIYILLHMISIIHSYIYSYHQQVELCFDH